MSRQKNLIDPATGRFIRLHKIVSITCPCNKVFETSQDRVDIGRGKYCSKKCMYSYRKMRTGEKHHQWSGSKPKYSALHKWMAKVYGQSMTCEWCGFESDNTYQIQWANLTGLYKRDRDDWARLCAKCHYAYDRKGATAL